MLRLPLNAFTSTDSLFACKQGSTIVSTIGRSAHVTVMNACPYFALNENRHELHCDNLIDCAPVPTPAGINACSRIMLENYTLFGSLLDVIN